MWRHGPVHRDVYEAYHGFGHDPVPSPQPPKGGIHAPVVPAVDANALSIIDQVVEFHRRQDDLALSEMAHAPGSPWKIVAARHGFRVPVGTVVDEALIERHFGAILNALPARAA